MALRRGRVRVAEAPGQIGRRAGRGRPGSASRCLSRADKALRGDRPRHRRGACGAVSRAGQGRGDGRGRAGRGAPRRGSTTRSEPCGSSSPRVRRAARPRTPSRGSRTCPATSSTAGRSRRPIDAVRRPRYPSLSALPAQRMKEVPRASSSRNRGGGSRGARRDRSAGAWSWPADGDVLRPFALGGDAYAAGQHRGIDVAGAEGSPVRSPASGTVSFAGTLPTYGRGVTILTADGYAVTLVHLGSRGREGRRGDRGRAGREHGLERRPGARTSRPCTSACASRRRARDTSTRSGCSHPVRPLRALSADGGAGSGSCRRHRSGPVECVGVRGRASADPPATCPRCPSARSPAPAAPSPQVAGNGAGSTSTPLTGSGLGGCCGRAAGSCTDVRHDGRRRSRRFADGACDRAAASTRGRGCRRPRPGRGRRRRHSTGNRAPADRSDAARPRVRHAGPPARRSPASSPGGGRAASGSDGQPAA